MPKSNVWKIFKSETAYLKYVSIAAYTLAVLINLAWLASGKMNNSDSINQSRSIFWLSLFLTFFAFYLGFYRKSFRLSIYSKLPVKRKQMAVSRMLVLMTFWGGIIIVDFIFRMILSSTLQFSAWVESTVFLTGVVLLMESVSFILQDINSMFYDKIKRNTFNTVLGVLSVIIYLSFVFMDSLFDETATKLFHKSWRDLTDFYFTDTAAIAVFALGIILLIVSYFTFGKRKSFIE